jgi:hypothetical protein
MGTQTRERLRGEPMRESELAALLRSLGGAQTNDSGSLLQRLGVLQEGSEMSSLENVATRASKPPPKPSGAQEEFFLSGGDPDETMGDKVKRGLRQGRD